MTVTFTNGGTLSVIQHSDPRRMIVFLTSVHKVKKALDGTLGEVDAPALAQFFEEASKGQRQAAIAHSPTTRHVQLESGAYWILPAWYAEAIGILAQDVFRLHAFVSAISAGTSRALFIDRVTGHRLERGEVHEHRTLVKASLHRWSGGCACRAHGIAPPTEPFHRLELRMEFCGCKLRERQVPHPLAGGACAAVGALPGRLHARPEDGPVVHAPGGRKAACACRWTCVTRRWTWPFARARCTTSPAAAPSSWRPSAHDGELRLDMEAALGHLDDLRSQHAHVGEKILQRDVLAVDLLRRGGVLSPAGAVQGARACRVQRDPQDAQTPV